MSNDDCDCAPFLYQDERYCQIPCKMWDWKAIWCNIQLKVCIWFSSYFFDGSLRYRYSGRQRLESMTKQHLKKAQNVLKNTVCLLIRILLYVCGKCQIQIAILQGTAGSATMTYFFEGFKCIYHKQKHGNFHK